MIVKSVTTCSWADFRWPKPLPSQLQLQGTQGQGTQVLSQECPGSISTRPSCPSPCPVTPKSSQAHPRQEGRMPHVRLIPPDLKGNGHRSEVWVGQLRWNLPPTRLPPGVTAEGCTQGFYRAGWGLWKEVEAPAESQVESQAVCARCRAGGTCPAAREPTPQGAAWHPARESKGHSPALGSSEDNTLVGASGHWPPPP